MVGLPVVWLLASRGDARELAAELSAPAIEQVAVHPIHLRPLGQPDIDAIVARIIGAPPAGQTRRRLRGTGGNPFLAVQFAEAVAAGSGPAGEGGDAAVPATLVAAVRARLSRLSPAAQTLVQLVAVCAARALGISANTVATHVEKRARLTSWSTTPASPSSARPWT